MKCTKAAPCSASRQIRCASVQRIMLLALFGGVILAMSPTKAGAQKNCYEIKKSFAFPNATIDVSSEPGGFYIPPDFLGTKRPYPSLPLLAFYNLPPRCQVTAKIKPTSDSDINVQVWLPTERYNGDYLGTGNGGYAVFEGTDPGVLRQACEPLVFRRVLYRRSASPNGGGAIPL